MSHLLPDKPGSHWKRNSIEHNNLDPAAVNLERKNGAGNVYNFDSTRSPGTLLDKWKEYTEGEDEESIINNIYTPQTSTSGNNVIVGKKEQLPSEESREKLRDLRLKARVREQQENQTATPFTSQQQTMSLNYDTNDNRGKSTGSTYYAVPNQKVVNVDHDDIDDETVPKRKERWYKKAHKIFKHTKHQ